VPLTEANMVRAILGEAEGEPYTGKVALAYALKNRGTMSGVYGHKAISTRLGGYYRGDRKLKPSVVKEAQKALEWANSHPELDTTSGATHWEGTAFKTPYWAHSMVKTVVIGHQAFYKEA